MIVACAWGSFGKREDILQRGIGLLLHPWMPKTMAGCFAIPAIEASSMRPMRFPRRLLLTEAFFSVIAQLVFSKPFSLVGSMRTRVGI